MPATTPWNKVLCPYCFKRYHPSHCTVVAEKDGTILRHPPRGLKKAVSSFWVKEQGGENSYRQPRLHCPNPACGKAWPEDIELAENYIIAVVGALTSGKSIYIAMAIHELKENARVRRAMGVTKVVPLSDAVEAHYRKDYDDLVKYRRILKGTRPMVPGDIAEPLIYQLNFDSSLGERRPVYIYLYDVAGEDITREDKAQEFSRFLLHADAIILMADPFAMPKMRIRIHPQYHPLVLPDMSPSDVLYGVVKRYRKRWLRALDIPIAVTISKSDMLEFADPQRRSSLFATPSHYDARFAHPLQLQELNQVSGDVRQLLQVYGDDDLVSWASQYEKVGYFAVSATGFPPSLPVAPNPLAPNLGGGGPLQNVPTLPNLATPAVPTLEFPAIEPLRVLDPFLWSLHQLGVIQAE